MFFCCNGLLPKWTSGGLSIHVDIMDLQSVLLDEIALEGLDGITLPTLFIRLKQVDDFPYDLDDELVQGS